MRRVSIAAVLILAILVAGTVGYRVLGEGRWGWSDCAYMTAITVSTVGFREVVPVDTTALRVFTMSLILTGTGMILYLMSNLTAFLVEGDLNQLIRRRRMDRELAGIEGHFVLCGVGRSGGHAGAQMLAGGHKVVLVDRSEEKLRAFIETTGRGTPYLVGDATDESVLERAGVRRGRGLVAALPEDQDNIYLILSARQLNPRLRIVSKYNEPRSRQKFLQVGADAVVSPTAMGGLRLFSEMVRPGVMSFLDDVLHETAEDLTIDEVQVTAGSDMNGRRLDESGIRRRTNLLVVGVRDGETGRFTYNPGPDLKLRAGMTLIVLGPRPAVEELRRIGAGTSGPVERAPA